jgi:hypothetical protein
VGCVIGIRLLGALWNQSSQRIVLICMLHHAVMSGARTVLPLLVLQRVGSAGPVAHRKGLHGDDRALMADKSRRGVAR